MQILNLIQTVVNSLNAAPNTTLSDVLQVVNSLATLVESLCKHQEAINASASSTPQQQNISQN